MAVRTYDPKSVVLVFGGATISGYADGTFITVERNSDNFSMISGADGEVSRAKTNDRTGSITITLTQTSPSNSLLSFYEALDQRTGSGVAPVGITDLKGGSTYFSGNGWVRKPANAEFSKEISNREYIIDCDNVSMVSVGNIETRATA